MCLHVHGCSPFLSAHTANHYMLWITYMISTSDCHDNSVPCSAFMLIVHIYMHVEYACLKLHNIPDFPHLLKAARCLEEKRMMHTLHMETSIYYCTITHKWLHLRSSFAYIWLGTHKAHHGRTGKQLSMHPCIHTYEDWNVSAGSNSSTNSTSKIWGISNTSAEPAWITSTAFLPPPG